MPALLEATAVACGSLDSSFSSNPLVRVGRTIALRLKYTTPRLLAYAEIVTRRCFAVLEIARKPVISRKTPPTPRRITAGKA